MSERRHPVLECVPLREAVYRQCTSSRALRHNITRSCVPVAMLPAVAPWLPPWDVIPPETALRSLKSLHIIHRAPQSSPVKAEDVLQDVAHAVERSEPALCRVSSLTLSIKVPYDMSNTSQRNAVAFFRILRCFPALRALTLPTECRNYVGMIWQSTEIYHSMQRPSKAAAQAPVFLLATPEHSGRLFQGQAAPIDLYAPLKADGSVDPASPRCWDAVSSDCLFKPFDGAPVPNVPAHRVVDIDDCGVDIAVVRPAEPVREYIAGTPRLTSLDIRGVFISTSRDMDNILMRSLLVSRLSLTTLVTDSWHAVDQIAEEYCLHVDDPPPRLLSDKPVYEELSEERLSEITDVATEKNGEVPAALFNFHSPAWTLRSFTVEAKYPSASGWLQKLWCFVLACPSLEFLKLSWPLWRFSKAELWRQEHHPLSTPPEPHDSWTPATLGVEAHNAVLHVVSAVERQDPVLKSLSDAQVSALQSIVTQGTYPKALHWILARGPRLTTLRRVDVDHVSPSDSAAIHAVLWALQSLQRSEQRKRHGKYRHAE